MSFSDQFASAIWEVHHSNRLLSFEACWVECNKMAWCAACCSCQHSSSRQHHPKTFMQLRCYLHKWLDRELWGGWRWTKVLAKAVFITYHKIWCNTFMAKFHLLFTFGPNDDYYHGSSRCLKCGQSHKRFTSVIYDCRFVPKLQY